MQRLVLKVGSAVLTQNGRIAHRRLDNLVEFISLLKKSYDVILVSSGAVAAGYTLLQLDKSIIANKQALASIGQPHLLSIYQNEFSKYGLISSQVLLEASIFNDNKRLNHAIDAIEVMLKNNVVPIINENDVTAVDELVFGDNDQLSAYITHYFNADLLTILTDIDGYYDKNPHENKDAKLKKIVDKIEPKSLEEIHSANSEFATGGIVTKLKAADFLLQNNKKMFLTSGFDLTYAKDFLLYKKQTNGTIFEKQKKG
ncbi:MAG: glutamate 5-kinase [Campylobacterota bacterium]|nr:glutamate 5-kinase [Campylobacterota bacterium]